MSTKLFSFNFVGNVHSTAKVINVMCPEIIPGIIAMDCSGSYTIVVYRAEEEHPRLKPRPEVEDDGA